MAKYFFRLGWVLVLPMLLGFTGRVQLKKEDVRLCMQEMFALHVEYKDFSPLLARRVLKIYFEQFDPERVYLLSSEVNPFLNPNEQFLNRVVQKYGRNDLSEFAALNQVIQRAITRARLLRTEVEKELITSSQDTFVRTSAYSSYASNEEELKGRIRTQFEKILAYEKRNGTLREATAEQKGKLFSLWEKRFARAENPYLPQDKGGNGPLTEHFLSLHVLKAMAKSLDAHTSYFSPDEALEMRALLEKEFEGIGVVLREGVDGVVITECIKGGPAERSKQILSGDLIVEINGESIEGTSYEMILRKLQGERNSKVKLGLRRFDAQNKAQVVQVELKRERIVMQDDRLQYSFVPFADGMIAKLNLPSFYESMDGSSCEIDMREALRALKKEGKIYGLVLDMRDNSGGFLNQAVKVGGLFISSGVIVISKYSQGEIQYLRNLDGRSYYDGPLVILTSKASASAAEIVAQALQDYGTAIVVGDERTYGKGTIQFQTITDPKATSFFKVTVGRYYTVSGRSTQIEGVKADIVVPTVYSAFNIGERYLEYPLKSDQIPAAYIDPLTDVDPRNYRWFEKNYLPNLQKKISIWTQMLPQLQQNSAIRLSQNRDYQAFLQALEKEKKGISSGPSLYDNWGIDDLQMQEAVEIVKDMILVQSQAETQRAA